MATPLQTVPDTLVLGAGGTLGIAWLRGLITGIEEGSGLDLRRCEYFVGTSAGAYVAAYLAAGHRAGEAGGDPGETPDAGAELPPDPDGEPGALAALRRVGLEGGRLAATAAAPLMPLALAASRPPGAVARAAALAVAPRPRARPVDLARHAAELGSRFDGRLRVVTVDRRSGRRVVFGAPGEPEAEVAPAVLASCSVPWIFAPVEIGGREYVDGGVWSLSNLDVAPVRRGSEVLALLPTFGRGLGGASRTGLGLLRAAAQAAGLAELQVLRARGARTRIVAPDPAVAQAMGGNLMDARRRSSVLAAGRIQGRRLAAG